MNYCAACRPSWRGLHCARSSSWNINDKLGAASAIRTPDRPKWLKLAAARSHKLARRASSVKFARRRLHRKTKVAGTSEPHDDDVQPPQPDATKPSDVQVLVPEQSHEHMLLGPGCLEGSAVQPQPFELDALVVGGLDLPRRCATHCADMPWKGVVGDIIFGKIELIKQIVGKTDACFVIAVALDLLNQWAKSGPPESVSVEVVVAAFLSCAVAIQTPPGGYECNSGLVEQLEPQTVAEFLRHRMRCLAGRGCFNQVVIAEWLVMNSVFCPK